MIDLEHLRNNPELFRKKISERGKNADLDAILATDRRYRQELQNLELLRADRKIKSATAAKDPAIREELKKTKNQVTRSEEAVRQLKETLEAAIREIPNLQHDDVPVGQTEADNLVLREVGEKPKLAKPKDYLTIAEELGIIDIKRAAKVSGTRFGYLLGTMAQLEFAMIQYCQSILLPKGFTLVIPPVLIKNDNMAAMGYLSGGGEDETYHLEKDGLYLVGTSEQSIGPMHRDEVFTADELPRRYLAFSTCFRREAGSHGKDTKGIIRVHQFDKLEMFSLTTPESSDTEHEFLLARQEQIVQGLGLPYRVLKLCAGDTSYPSARTYDIEVWFPSEQRYRETHSASTTTDFQSRALNIKVATKTKPVYAHMLNATAFTNRLTIALIENYQKPDGGFTIPKALQPFMVS